MKITADKIEIVIDNKKVSKTGTLASSAVIYINKKYIGREVIVLIKAKK